MLNKYRQRKLRLVKRYFKAHPEVKLIAVAGSVGKSTTKNMIGAILQECYRIGGALEDDNINTEITCQLAYWVLKILRKLDRLKSGDDCFREPRTRVKKPATVDVIIQN